MSRFRSPQVKSPFRQRCHHFCTAVFPSVVFGIAILSVAFLWSEQQHLTDLSPTPPRGFNAAHPSETQLTSPDWSNASTRIVNGRLAPENRPPHFGASKMSELKLQTAHD